MLLWASSSIRTICGLTRENAVEVHLLEDDAFVFDLPTWDFFELFGEFGCTWPAVCLDDADHNVFSALVPADRLAEHVVGLAYAGRVAEKELEGAAGLLRRDLFQPFLGALYRGIRIVTSAHKDKIRSCSARSYAVSFATVCRRPLPLSL